jgi:uncharacterized repeat protein (TIGR01451 family)
VSAALAVALACLASIPGRPARAEPQASAVGAAVASGSDELVTEIVAEQFEPAEPGSGAPGRYVPAGRLAEGDVVHYTIRVRNPGQQPVTGVQVTKQLPLGVHYVEGSAAGPDARVEFSADGGATFLSRAPESGFTHLRWTLHRPLPPGATALLRFRASFR